MTRQKLEQAIKAKTNWFHSIDFGKGLISPGRVPLEAKQRFLKTLNLPSLKNKTVLDIGAWDGFWSFEAERRGAQVTALDSYCWNGPGTGDKKGFDLAHKWFNSKVKTIEMDVIDICPEKTGQYDIVFFFAVLYHMKHPLLALEKVASVTKEVAIIETHLNLNTIPTPAMAFYPGTELNGDGSNWFSPNIPAMTGMLQTAGFKHSKYKIHRTINENQARGLFYAYK